VPGHAIDATNSLIAAAKTEGSDLSVDEHAARRGGATWSVRWAGLPSTPAAIPGRGLLGARQLRAEHIRAGRQRVPRWTSWPSV